jgi:DNA-directed RNA polymerase specialized sigma24 family protein
VPRPLQKQTRDGKPYSRPSVIEQAIDVALQQDEATLVARAALDRTAEAYLPNECLVHLIREAKRLGDRHRMNAFVPLLLRRCVGNLRATVSDQLPAAEELREEIIGQLLELIAIDGSERDKLRLDFFEIHFDEAFQKLRIDFVRPHVSRASKERATEDIERLAGEDDSGDEFAMQNGLAIIADHLHLLAANERTAIGLKYLEELKEHSINPNEPTIAKLMGVSERMVRNYLQSAKQKLRTVLKGCHEHQS